MPIVRIPISKASGDITIDWGDGTEETITAETINNNVVNSFTIPHEYTVAGEYTVQIHGPVVEFGTIPPDTEVPAFPECTVTSVESFGTYDTLEALSFYPCASSLKAVPDALPPSVTNLYTAFYGCALDDWSVLSGWNTSNVTNMTFMFPMSSVNADISGWDTSSVTYMESMFSEASSFNQDISGWDTSKVGNMGYMFYNAASFNQDLSSWCVSLISSRPAGFSTGTAGVIEPIWGTCPDPLPPA